MKRFIACLILLQLCLAPLAQADCNTARDLYDQAQSADTASKKVRLLESAAEHCDWFPIQYALGAALAQTKDWSKAEAAFQKGFCLAQKPKNKAASLHCLARLNRHLGQNHKAVLRYKQCLEIRYDPGVEQEMLNLETKYLQDITDAKTITNTIKASRSIGVAPSVDLRVHFAFDSAELTAQGRRQAREMAEAIRSLGEVEVTLIGHTDQQGSRAYNDQLSLARARAVKQYLLDRQSVDFKRISIKGRGERDLLYQENTEEAHRLNRRVEMRVESSF